MTQAHFLASLGLQQRVEALLRSAASDERRSDIQSAARRLVDLTGMGAQYKVLGIEASPTQSVGAPRADEDTLPPELVYPFESS